MRTWILDNTLNEDELKFDGNIIVHGDINIKKDCIITGFIESTGSMTIGGLLKSCHYIESQSFINTKGDIESKMWIVTNNRIGSIQGHNIIAGSDIKTGGSIFATGFLDVKGNIRADDAIISEEDITAIGYISAGSYIKSKNYIKSEKSIIAGEYIEAGSYIVANNGYQIFSGVHVRDYELEKKGYIKASEINSKIAYGEIQKLTKGDKNEI